MQYELSDLLAQADRSWWQSIDLYARANKDRYSDYAAFITLSHWNTEEVFKRLAFSILSVQTPFDRACGAFSRLMKLDKLSRGSRTRVSQAIDGVMYRTVKTRGLVNAWFDCQNNPRQFEKQPAESWDTYRRRLTKLYGLGKAKASFAACLLYPLEADIACLDTWILKHFGLEQKNGRLSWDEYLACEALIRSHAQRWQVSTFLAQWLIWDHARGNVESHSILGLPGGHKDI